MLAGASVRPKSGVSVNVAVNRCLPPLALPGIAHPLPYCARFSRFFTVTENCLAPAYSARIYASMNSPAGVPPVYYQRALRAYCSAVRQGTRKGFGKFASRAGA